MRDYKNLFREVKGQKPRIYCDMDGVLCDFIVQAKKATGKIFTQDKAKEHWEVIKKYPKSKKSTLNIDNRRSLSAESGHNKSKSISSRLFNF